MYRDYILAPGKQPLLLLFVGFIVAFLSIRLSVRMIRAGVSWWPGNINRGGLHIHHVVFGIGLMTVCGVASFAPFSSSLAWRSVVAAGFGVGTALVLDEFALILHLKDVYWTEEGRRSVDAVFLGVALMGMLVLGAAPLGFDDTAASGERVGRWDITLTVLLNALLVIITLAKGKVWTGLIGVLAPGLAFVGALRLARPSSPWARRFYRPESRKLRRAIRRERRWHGRFTRVRRRIADGVAGKPHLAGPTDRRGPG
ncbi:hypothetical protein [Paractinoplanes globisporus]|uniref:Integral membrane protein n=1 Tax=Paractinoplanes globisporus TaxID=113565 RepID=A0ABW6WUY2_9ACTN|nr:hypothetical protein [Actinoplanes globisporus]